MVRFHPRPPTFAHDRRRRLPAVARSAEAGLSNPRTSFGWQANLRDRRAQILGTPGQQRIADSASHDRGMEKGLREFG